MAIYKYCATLPYFKNQTTVINKQNVSDDTFCLFIGKGPKISLNNFFLVEAGISPDMTDYYVFAIKRQNNFINLTFPVEQDIKENNISICFVCTNNNIYIEMLKNAVDYYKKFDVAVSTYNWQCNFARSAYNQKFESLASARNNSIELARNNIIFSIDVDTIIPYDIIKQIANLVIKYNVPVNIKNSVISGNGLNAFSKKMFNNNKYYTKFTGYYREDTEFLMNFSRTGYLPIIYINNQISITNHTRYSTEHDINNNFDLMRDIIINGRV